jgi:hypothetical protein
MADDLADPALAAILQVWEQKRGDRAMARRRDIDPADLPRSLLPHVQITDVVDGGRRFRCRLVGTAIANAIGMDTTGRYVDETLTGDRQAVVAQPYMTVCERKRPTFTRHKYLTSRGTEFTSCRIHMPLSENDIDVNMILSAVTFRFCSAVDRGVLATDRLDISESAIRIL